MEIKIEKLFCLYFHIAEIDEHVPSMRMEVVIEVQQFGHSLEYRGNMWVDCSAWDTFVTRLNSVGKGEAKLVDMGGHFTLCLVAAYGGLVFSWEMKKAGLEGAVAIASFRSPIDEGTLAHVKNQFMQFDRWWS